MFASQFRSPTQMADRNALTSAQIRAFVRSTRSSAETSATLKPRCPTEVTKPIEVRRDSASRRGLTLTPYRCLRASKRNQSPGGNSQLMISAWISRKVASARVLAATSVMLNSDFHTARMEFRNSQVFYFFVDCRKASGYGRTREKSSMNQTFSAAAARSPIEIQQPRGTK